ncbi:MAG: hypothetical protein M1819_003153 [Sarea resinae]|nr:MAG: hypothetical protein M1819_003153 [Sarea resinae]
MTVPPFKVKAVYDYTSEHDDDLNFPNGQVITVTEEEDPDWYFGRYEDASGESKEGLFPKNFVERYEPAPPPRPTRINRPRKEAEPVAPATPPTPAKVSEEPEEIEEHAPEEIEPAERQQPTTPSRQIPTATANDVQSPASPSSSKSKSRSLPPAEPPKPAEVKPATTSVPKPAPPVASKPPPPAVAEKPSGGSFRDRIAAFNKPAAPPIAPFKPGGASSTSSSFIKKPFVAPPPSRNAYVPTPREPPPQKIYRREEDPDIAENAARESEASERPPPVAPTSPSNDEEDQPKPTSLKERIALLQKQQAEQAARHAEAVHKKEKPKRPAKKRTESHERTEAVESAEGAELEKVDSTGTASKRSMDINRDEGASTARPPRRKSSGVPAHPGSPTIAPTEFLSDANDADQSAAGETTEDAGELSVDTDEKSRHEPLVRTETASSRGQEPPNRDEDDKDVDEEEEEDDDDVDPEVKRKLEIRERMAKMSGGMGMYGMFGPPGGLPPMQGGPRQKASGSHKKEVELETAEPPLTSPRIPIMPMPGMQQIRSPEPEEEQISVQKEEEPKRHSILEERSGEVVPDVEEVDSGTPRTARRSEEGREAPPVPIHDRHVPETPTSEAGIPPPVPGNRPAPPALPTEARPFQPTPQNPPFSPSAGSESDDELSSHQKRLSIRTPLADTLRTPSIASPSAPSRPEEERSPVVPPARRSSYFGADAASPSSPTAPGTSGKRLSRVPPIPNSIPMVPPPVQARPPPPPPPQAAAPPSRQSTGDSKAAAPSTKPSVREESDKEESEYDGDYDTDIAPGATHKNALKTDDRASSLDETLTDDAPIGAPPPVPPTGGPRAAPPPPPSHPPKSNRQSVDMPRAAPPPVPPAKEQSFEDDDEEYDPFRYTASKRGVPGQGINESLEDTYAAASPDEDLYSNLSPKRHSMLPQPPPVPPHVASPHDRAPPPPPAHPPQGPPPAAGSMSSWGPARQSMEVPRTQTSRRSMDQARPTGEHGYIARDIDMGESSRWWAQANTVPPTLQGRKDIIYEVEESNTPGRGGTISKDVYILFVDYSQTVVTARFSASDPSNVVLEQRQEPPPSRPRQDQLEEAHTSFGQRISEAASAKQNSIVGDGSAHGLVLELLKPLSGALLPVGTRAYGALVYANLANASVQQFDEIRAGDVLTLRNAKFQGHKGTMHQKYSAEVGKPDHVGIVVDWDGTKKKIRAWEQGRESKKVKMESFKVGDLRSGEVKVWRVMPRSWVGWEGQN